MQVMDGFSRERSKQSATRLSGKGKLLEIKKWVISMMLAARVVKWGQPILRQTVRCGGLGNSESESE